MTDVVEIVDTHTSIANYYLDNGYIYLGNRAIRSYDRTNKGWREGYVIILGRPRGVAVYVPPENMHGRKSNDAVQS